ncbi:MAG: fibronectin type III domain-containing protein [Candidatus Lokiarchaeota archaeon]
MNPTAISGSGQVSLSWSAPSDNGGSPITYYNIYRCTSSGSETFLTSVNATSTQYIDTEVTDGLTYYYNVSAINLAGEGPQSNEVNAIPTGVPSIPLNLQITPGNNKITLAWHIPSNNGGLTITGYNIYRGTSSGTEVILTTVNGSTLTYMDTGLTANTTYYYQISAINSAGVGQKSSEIHATTLTPNSKNTIGGMVIESLLLVSCISMIVIVLGVKKHIKK